MAFWVTEQSQCQEDRRIYDTYPTGYSEIVPQFNACIVVFILYFQGLMATSLYTHAKKEGSFIGCFDKKVKSSRKLMIQLFDAPAGI